MKINLKKEIASGKQIVGTWSDGHSNTCVEVAGMVGFDFVIIDNEHGCHNSPSLVDTVRTAESANIAPIIRVPNPHFEDPIKKALDMGASGVLVPNVETAEDAAQAVRYSKFAPLGKRGCCPYLRSNNYSLKYGTVDYYQKANEEVTTMILLECTEAVQNIEEIVKVPGIDALLIGRVDLSCSMGIPGQLNAPQMIEAIDKVVAVARKAGIPIGIVGFGHEDTVQWAHSGRVDFVTVGGDTGILIAAYQNDLNAIRGK